MRISIVQMFCLFQGWFFAQTRITTTEPYVLFPYSCPFFRSGEEEMNTPSPFRLPSSSLANIVWFKSDGVDLDERKAAGLGGDRYVPLLPRWKQENSPSTPDKQEVETH